MIKIAICDDEKFHIEKIENLLTARDDASDFEIHRYDNATALLQSEIKFELLFMDIELADANGVTVAGMMRNKIKNLFVFFTTSYTNYISEAFRIMPFQYLVKPLDAKLFNAELDRAIRILQNDNQKIIISKYNQKTSIAVKDVLYIEHYVKKLTYVLINGEIYYSNGKIVEVYEKLAPYGFARIHNGYLLNLKYLQKIKDYEAILTNGVKLPISKKYAKETRRLLFEKHIGIDV